MADDYQPPFGARYSQLYLPRGAPQPDSKRARRRVAAAFEHEFGDNEYQICKSLELRLGAEFHNRRHWEITEWLRKCSQTDFLDAITVIYSALARVQYADEARWATLCAAIFIEENIGYRVDEAGVVHPSYDEEFSRNVNSAIAGLSDARLAAVRKEAETAREMLTKVEPDTKGAVRAIFDACENLAKLAFPSVNLGRLDANTFEHHFKAKALRRQGMNRPAADALGYVVEGMKDWIKASHVYRHAQGVEEPAPPPIDVAVLMVSSGAATLRWMLEVGWPPEAEG